MCDLANDIVGKLYSGEPNQIEEAFQRYSSEVELAIRFAFEQKSEALQRIGFAKLPLSSITVGLYADDDSVDGVSFTLKSERTTLLKIAQEVKSYMDINILLNDQEKLQALLGCLIANCWSRDFLEVNSVFEDYVGEIHAWYTQDNRIYRRCCINKI